MKLFTKIEKIKELGLSGNWTNKNYNSTQEEIKFCRGLIENEVVEVKVMFERPEFIRTQTSKRVSFPDKLGAFGKTQNYLSEYQTILLNFISTGGTLGLFTGMSFLSMVEIIYWFLQCVFSSLKWNRSANQEQQISA